MKITVTYNSLDGCRKSGSFATLAGARGFAQKWVGATPEVSERFGYAVSGDGIGKITCNGCAIAELFASADADPHFAVDGFVSLQGEAFLILSINPNGCTLELLHGSGERDFADAYKCTPIPDPYHDLVDEPSWRPSPMGPPHPIEAEWERW